MKISELNNTNFNNKLVLVFLTVSILIYPLLFIWQGGDLTDSGFYAVHYQNFFNNLQVNETNSIIFFTELIGATWFKIFPNFGIIGLKILYLALLYGIMFFIYLTLKNITNNRFLLLLGIFTGLVFGTRNIAFVFNQDILSWFFLVIMTFVLLKGLSLRKSNYIFISGVLFGLACLSRFPDIILIVLLPFVVLNNQFIVNDKSTLHQKIICSIKQYIYFILGFFSLIVIFSGILYYYGVFDTFISNFDFVSKAINTQQNSSYSISNLIKSYLVELIIFFPHLIIITSLFIVISVIYNYSKLKRNYFPVIIYVLMVFVVALLTYKGFSFSNAIKYFIPAFCFLPLLLSIIIKPDLRKKFGNITVIISLIAIVQVAGTNTGLFLKLFYGFYFLIPLTFLVLEDKKHFIFENISINTKPILIIGICFILFFSSFTRIGYIYHVDSGLLVRLRLIYPIEHELMKGIYSTKENSLHIKNLCKDIDSNFKNDNTLFIYGHQPMFYYLTKKNPPVKEYWLNNETIQIDELFTSINESIKSTGKWPMIVDTKQNVLGVTGEKRLSEFLRKNNYVLVENTDNYYIWNRI